MLLAHLLRYHDLETVANVSCEVREAAGGLLSIREFCDEFSANGSPPVVPLQLLMELLGFAPAKSLVLI